MDRTIERLTYTVTDAARMLGISRNLAYDLIKQGRLPAIRISDKRLIVPKAALLKLLASWGIEPRAGEAGPVSGTNSGGDGPEQGGQ